MERTDGTLLNGRLRYAQPRHGYRTGIEPVFLAAAVPARPGQRVLEAGCGAGAGLLCLLWRIAGLDATGVEIEPDMAALARDNLAANGFPARIETADITAGITGPFDHAFANPPWHDPAATRPLQARRALATHGAGLDHWIAALALAVGGTTTLALPMALVPSAAAMLAGAGIGRVAVLPLLPKAGRPAKVALMQAHQGPSRIREAAGLVLHNEDGGYTEAAEAVLRRGAALSFG